MSCVGLHLYWLDFVSLLLAVDLLVDYRSCLHLCGLSVLMESSHVRTTRQACVQDRRTFNSYLAVTWAV